MTEVRFRSRIDAWLVIVIVAAFLVGPLLVIASPGNSNTVELLTRVGVVVAFAVPAALVLWWVFTTTDYTVTDTDLLVRSGPIKWNVPIASIRSVRPTRTILSAPALSTDRLEILYGTYGSVVVSPAEKDAFIQALCARNPKIESRTQH